MGYSVGNEWITYDPRTKSCIEEQWHSMTREALQTKTQDGIRGLKVYKQLSNC